MASPRLGVLVVCRNETHRYLQAVIVHAAALTDEIFVYDDRSTDDSVEISMASGAAYATVRQDGVPAFLDHEGFFRQGAWEAYERVVQPDVQTWTLSLDADEMLVAELGRDVRSAVDAAIAVAERAGAASVRLPVPEVFSVATGPDGLLTRPQVRVDGLWGTIAGTRLFAWRPGGVFGPKAMGCGSEPTYVAAAPVSEHTAGLELVHLGYADVADQYEKYHRYSSLSDHGHADAHVQSIIAPGRLVAWNGAWPRVWRGVRA